MVESGSRGYKELEDFDVFGAITTTVQTGIKAHHAKKTVGGNRSLFDKQVPSDADVQAHLAGAPKALYDFVKAGTAFNEVRKSNSIKTQNIDQFISATETLKAHLYTFTTAEVLPIPPSKHKTNFFVGFP